MIFMLFCYSFFENCIDNGKKAHNMQKSQCKGANSMIKGCTKRVIVVKDVSSDIFEEAYFILRPTSANTKVKKSESDIISEANRIVTSQNCDSRGGVNSISLKTPKVKRSRGHDFAVFVFGFLTAAALYGIYYLL